MDCQSFIELVRATVPNSLSCGAVEGGVLVVLPVEHPNGDAVEVVVSENDEGLAVYDAGLSAMYLAGYGIDLTSSDGSSAPRKNRVVEYARSKGCEFVDEEIVCRTGPDGLYEALFQVAAVAQMVTGLPDAIPANRASEFVDELAGFFQQLGASPSTKYRIDGFTRVDTFDIRLNGRGERLIKTIATKRPGVVTAKIERAWYAFSDVARVGREFTPTIVFDDEDEESRAAWRERHFRMADRLGVPVFGFYENQDQLVAIAQHHAG